MKRFSLYITLLCTAFGTCVSASFAATSTLSTVAPIVGSATGENAGNLMFDSTTGLPSSERVSINGNTLDFVGTFWSQNAGWMTFGGLGVNGAKLTGAGNNMSMVGFAWSQNAGWISFNPRGVVSTTNSFASDVFFDKAAGKFHGFAWSENLGWINMEGVMTDITAPDITANFKPFAANNSKTFTVSDPSPVALGIDLYKFEVSDWNDDITRYRSIYSTADSKFTHDFRKAKNTYYHLRITDPFGNSSEGTVKVVADVPADTITTPIDGFTAGGSASAYVSTFAESKVADAVQVHSMNISLRDRYGNPVITEPGIKTVNMYVSFNNNVDTDQSFSTGIFGDAIIYPLQTFGLISGRTSNSGYDSNTSGDYSLDISSYAPTKAGYVFTNPNNISLQKLTYEVVATGGNSGVGETGGQIDKKNKIGINNLRFAPALFIGNVTNSDNWTILQGYATDFSANLLTATTAALTNPKVAHILDIDSNILMSYQNPSNITGGTEVCNGYMKTITTFNGAYTYSDGACNRPDSSNILISPTNLNGTMGFSWIPKIIYATPANSVVKYTSEIAYKNGGVDVKYPSYSRNNSSTTLADGTILSVADTGVGVVNQSVKILGMTNARNSIDVLQGNDTNKVGSLTRTDIKNAIHKNVEIMTRGGVPPAADYEVHTGDYTIPATWPVGKDTIIVKGGNVTINNNITNGATIKGIIVLEDDAGLGGRIYISKNVSNIAAVLYTDKSIISGNSAIYYSDTLPNVQTATGQLFIEGSIISDNTIGGASMTPLKCPYGAETCTDKEAKRYDLNYFRFYTGTGASSPGAAIGVPSAGIGYPLVIEYDNRLQTAPPPGFSMTE